MYRFLVGVFFVLVSMSFASAAESEQAAQQPKCVKAEINPVTGHVFCFEPLGAPVEPPAPDAALPCKLEDARGQWSWGPACAPEPGGM